MRRWLERRAKGPANADASSAHTSTISSTTPPASRKVFPSGIKLLHKATDSVVDIIFIHGLTGDREKTWTAKGAAAPWPQTLLPLKVPNTRILTFGYDAYIADWRGMVSQNRIGNHAMNLLAAIAAFRDDDDTNHRPLIFVCHSLGGLVCENALVIANQRPEKHLKSILELTRGIAFLGTPHHGSSLARWAEMLARSIGLFKQTNPEILQVLKTDSEVLAHIQDSFHTMIRSRAGATLPPIDITCFYEELSLPGVGTVVPSHSAILPGYIPIGIRSNHMDMTRFENADDPGFAIFAGELRRWVKHLAEAENTGVPEVIAAQPSQAEQRQDRTQPLFPHITFSGPENHGSQVGYNTGSVTNNFNLPAERPETPPIPLSTIPFPRDPDFVERKAMLDQIHSKCSVPASRTALVGLGGVGKSQLAIEYSYRAREQSPGTWVFWIHASNAARFEQSFRDVADQVKIPDRRNPKMDIFKAVHDWLRDEKHGRWIVVLDNADDARFLVESAPMRQSAQADSITTQPLFAYLPWSQNGSVLITTRNKSVALRLVEERNIIAVEPMDEVHAVGLLDRKLRYQNDAKDTTELAAALEFMPLAIVQAAAYIRHRTPRYSVRQYLEKFRKNDRQKSRLLGDDTGQFRRDWDAKNSIIITWQISFDHVQQTRPSAADLLSLMSLFDRQGIPEDLLRDRSEVQNEGDEGSPHISGDNKLEDSKDGASVSSMDDEFEDDILMLRDYSFVFSTNSTTLEMHGLVQLATRKWLETHGQLERWKRQYVKNLSAAFPIGNYENWGVCQALFPHAKAALEQKPEGERALLQWASVLYKAASYAWIKGIISDAENMSTQSMKLREKLLGQDNKETLTSMAMVALARNLAGRWKEAEELEVQVMETSSRVLGEEHPNTLTSMVNLASTFWNQGRWTEAEELGVRVMETRKRVLGEEHPSTLTSMANLASTFWNQGRWTEAEELEVRVMETSSRVLEEEHPNTLTSMANLSSTYRNQGRWTEAEELGVRVMETRKRVLGEEHPNTLTSMANLASTYRNQGRWTEAEELQARELKLCSKALGEEHPDTLTSMANLASTYQNQGRWTEAEELQARELKLCSKALGEEHPDTLISMENLAWIWVHQSNRSMAVELLTKVVQLRTRIIGPNHPYTRASLQTLDNWQKEL